MSRFLSKPHVADQNTGFRVNVDARPLLQSGRSLRHTSLQHALGMIVITLLLGTGSSTCGDEAKPPALEDSSGPDGVAVLVEYCMGCHDKTAAAGEFVLSLENLDWSDAETVSKLASVHTMLEKQIMPPADADRPDVNERKSALAWLDQTLVKHSPIGGTPLRRLSGREYANTVASIFGFNKFDLPDSFPPDNESHGFDNQGAALVLAASHLEAFADTAAQIADEIFPPEKQSVKPLTFDIPSDELVISYSSACLIDGTMRLASSGSNEVRNATWPTKFEAPESGIYEIEISASSYDPRDNADHVPQLHVESTLTSGKGVPNSADLSVIPGKTSSLRFKIGLDQGATFRMRYSNGPFNYEDKQQYPEFLEQLFLKQPRLAAAWQNIGSPARGGNGWARLKEVMQNEDLDTTDFRLSGEPLDAIVKAVAKNSVSSGETLVYKFFEEGPYIAIDRITIHGPIQKYLDSNQLRTQRQNERFLKTYASSQNDSGFDLVSFCDAFLSKVFRRPATESEIQSYVELIRSETKRWDDQDRGMHLAIRTALISPAFLYRSIGPGELSEFELASRLSYFLTSAPPDETLLNLAASGKLSGSRTLRKQTQRLLGNSQRFAEDFTRQWLGLDAVDRLMPDSRLIRKFTFAHRTTMKDEVTLTFREILDNNLSINQFIAPNYVFTDQLVGWEIYGLTQFRPNKKKKQKFKKGIQRVAVDPLGRRGGLLTMPALMMATANGVDTQPVLRGVWLLENILGSPPPNPPKAVPALTPDTAGTSSPKERLAAHMAEDSCAACHREIDPLGFVLENFDPIGRWRDSYPKYVDQGGRSKQLDGLAIDATGTLPEGIDLNDVTDLKRWLSENPQPFARCLSEKLMTYATGRSLNYRERNLVEDIIRNQESNELAFADLIVELIDSRIFRTK